MRQGDIAALGGIAVVIVALVIAWKQGWLTALANKLKGGLPPPDIPASQVQGLGVNLGAQKQCLCHGGKYVGNCSQAGQPCQGG